MPETIQKKRSAVFERVPPRSQALFRISWGVVPRPGPPHGPACGHAPACTPPGASRHEHVAASLASQHLSGDPPERAEKNPNRQGQARRIVARSCGGRNPKSIRDHVGGVLRCFPIRITRKLHVKGLKILSISAMANMKVSQHPKPSL